MPCSCASANPSGGVSPSTGIAEGRNAGDGVSVSVEPRHRERSASDVLRLLIGVALLGVGLVIHTWGRNTVLGAEAESFGDPGA